jgi:hypothetical protein
MVADVLNSKFGFVVFDILERCPISMPTCSDMAKLIAKRLEREHEEETSPDPILRYFISETDLGLSIQDRYHKATVAIGVEGHQDDLLMVVHALNQHFFDMHFKYCWYVRR